MLKNLENKGNPWGMNASSARLDWSGRPSTFACSAWTARTPRRRRRVPVLGRLRRRVRGPRQEDAPQAVAELLHIAGVEFAVLGEGETCTGDPARRLGNEFVFQMLAQQNVETLNEVGADEDRRRPARTASTRSSTSTRRSAATTRSCTTPSCWTTLVEDGRLTPVTPIDETVTYHDPCYLGRHNKVYTPAARAPRPRARLQHQGDARAARTAAFCCGAGGARMWMEEKIGKRDQRRAHRRGAGHRRRDDRDGCPFCSVMLSDGVTNRSQGKDAPVAEVKDVATLLLDSVRT